MNYRVQHDALPVLQGLNCLDLASSWKECVPEILSRVPKKKHLWSVTSALKSCSRLFDRRCDTCDAVSSEKAIRSWLASISDRETMGSMGDLSRADLLSYLKMRSRILVDGWGARLVRARKESVDPSGGSDVYFPDQQGCLEASRASGGTMSVSVARSMLSPSNHLRVACAKTKGKNRVVTVQPARVKRILRPVHTALYDHISSFGWCVRGEVTSEDFLAVSSDRRDGESFISGDYSSATDKIYLLAVEAMVEVLLESPSLSSEERSELMGSFRDLEVFTGSPCSLEYEGRVSRGQMMGNLVSFPLLCILNKVCFDLTCDLSGHRSGRIGRFNGDDCLFSGDRHFYETWQRVTAAFGFVVNTSKTGFSPRFGELNSRCFDYKRGRFLRKISLSFLRPVERNCPGDILSGIIQGTEGLRMDVRLWIVCSLMRYEICLRTISLAPLPPLWRTILLRRRWFRDALHSKPAPTKEYGDDRSLPVKLGPLPEPKFYRTITVLARRLASDHVARWTGCRARPFRSYLLRGDRRPVLPRSPFFSRIDTTWGFLWPARLLAVAGQHPEWFVPTSWSRRKWVEDHPFLSVRCTLVRDGLRSGKVSYQAVPDMLVSGIPCGGVLYCER